MKKLPDSEFEVMEAVWKLSPPVSTNEITSMIGGDKHWKPQTILTLLTRLVEKGFLESSKQGRERRFSPIISEEEYLQVETKNFMKRHYNNSITQLVNTLYDGKGLSNKDIDELKEWLNNGG
ncbi:CopY family transcriptional regulator [Listeria fleischmannii 1991]|uniref:CopY family transcriptional regulator n=1 Tax=Listeria fleischmannii 1991 TaxID=1430899 RepID=A0A0J8GAA2_9LIST|nr:BlaI/MecI/CopY family transcriptional regulator [Listeria fleischmannii]EMG26935.1 CopY family transcriptional regulator [Listeria fleischmannii subsp. fleischmannii LU2006-1]KMT57749.1 CopY family transcriptional regulator [Listeria fleischmannii 1991]